MEINQPVVIRDMKPGEERELLQAARRAFVHSPMELLAISKPKAALVAEVDGAVAGAVFLRIYGAGEKRTGYLDVGFVAREFRGLGVGRRLYPAATARLEELGCDQIAAMVIDDNAASWRSLANNGFGAPSLTEFARAFGLGRALSLWFGTLFCLAGGARLWMRGPVKDRRSKEELWSFLWVNLALFLPYLIRLAARPDQLLRTLPAYACVLLAGVLFGGAGCLAAGGDWHFSFPRGGALLTPLLHGLGVVYPMVGRWYPRNPNPTRECRRAMGIQASVEWLGLLLVFGAGALPLPFLSLCASLAANLLVYRLIPFMPFGSFGSARVWAWSKPAFALLALATIGLLVLVTTR